MLLHDRAIRAAVATGELGIDPFVDEHVQPSSVDVLLGKEFRVCRRRADGYRIDPRQDTTDIFRDETVGAGAPFLLSPGSFALGTTVERVHIPPHLAARLEGKSSLGRLGLLLHATAGFIDPGFEGRITLELANLTPLPLLLWPGMRIGQLCFFRMAGVPDKPYGSTDLGSHYQGQDGVTTSRIHEQMAEQKLWG